MKLLQPSTPFNTRAERPELFQSIQQRFKTSRASFHKIVQSFKTPKIAKRTPSFTEAINSVFADNAFADNIFDLSNARLDPIFSIVAANQNAPAKTLEQSRFYHPPKPTVAPRLQGRNLKNLVWNPYLRH